MTATSGGKSQALNEGAQRGDAEVRFTGRAIQLVQFDFSDGSSITAPAGEVTFRQSGADIVKDIIDIACKFFPKLCGVKDPDGDGGGGCYTIIGPDGTRITICPPGKGGIA